MRLEASDIHIDADAVNGTRTLRSHDDSVTVVWQPYEAGFGRTVSFATGAPLSSTAARSVLLGCWNQGVGCNAGTLELKIWSVPAGVLDEGGMPQPAYINFQLKLLASPKGDEAQVGLRTILLPTAVLVCQPKA